jgi:hypothetical protein
MTLPDYRTVAEAIDAFRSAAIAKGDAASSRALDHHLHQQMAAAVRKLESETSGGHQALQTLLADPSPHVRCWVASHLLACGDSRAELVLTTLASGTDLMALAAQMTLREHRAGRLKSPFSTE